MCSLSDRGRKLQEIRRYANSIERLAAHEPADDEIRGGEWVRGTTIADEDITGLCRADFPLEVEVRTLRDGRRQARLYKTKAFFDLSDLQWKRWTPVSDLPEVCLTCEPEQAMQQA